MSRPRISVILPVYNGQEYLIEAIDSVLSQTFRDFELIIINDGSTDGSAEIIRRFIDPRIRLYEQSNKGLAVTLNQAISLAKGEFIARQDQDDICHPERFRKQLEFLQSHPNVGMVGTFAEIRVGEERTNRVLHHPTDDISLKFGLLFNNHFVHSSMMIRRVVFDSVGVYAEDKSRQPPEDYELWSRVMRRFKLANLPDVLMIYREVPTSMSRTGVNPFVNNLVRISAENIAWASGRKADEPEVFALSALLHGSYESIPRDIKFSDLVRIVDAATVHIDEDADGEINNLGYARNAIVRRLAYRYWTWRCGGRLLNMINSSLARNIRKLFGLLRG